MPTFIKNGSIFKVRNEEDEDVHKLLPADTYTVQQSLTGFYLQKIDKFDNPKKIYGDVLKNTDRILNTFHKRSSSTGVLLSGEKGSGKTLLAKNISLEGLKLNLPSILVNQPFTGDDFNKFLQDIEQPCVILFDEFEKVYPSHHQEAILSLLDGMFSSKKLFLFTCNDAGRIDYHMKNRPGRIFYFLEYKGVEKEFIVEYCNDNLNNKSYIPAITRLPLVFNPFNFDMLKALVEEMNRYNESPEEVLKILNIRPLWRQSNRFNIQYFVNDTLVDTPRDNWDGNPLTETLSFYVKTSPEEFEETGERYEDAEFESSYITDITADGDYVYVKENKKVILSKVKEKTFDITKIL